MAIKMQQRRGTASEWTTANPILADGEIGYETDTGRAKVGDGVTTWTALVYRFESGGGGGVTDHGALTGLADDDHTQYLTEARHDALAQDNPHSVTATQVGLGNVDNTSDVDKPVSTAQALADAAVQNFSINRVNHIGTQLASTISNFSTAVRSVVLTGLNTVVGTANIVSVTASDTVLSAIGKLQARTALLFYGEFVRNTTGLINNTTTEADFLVLNATIPVAGEYVIDWTYEWSGNDAAQDIIVRLYSGVTVRWTNQQEPKDAAGTGVTLPNTTGGTSNSGTNQRHLGHAREVFVLPAGAHEAKITLDSSGNGDLNAIYKGVITIKKWGLN